MVPKKLSPSGEPQRHDDLARAGQLDRRLGAVARILLELLRECLQIGVAGEVDLATQPGEQVRAPLGQVGDVRRQPARVQAGAQHVGRRREQVGRDEVGQQAQALVALDQVPGPVDHDRRVRLVAFEHLADSLAGRRPSGAVERGLARTPGRNRPPAAAGCVPAAGTSSCSARCSSSSRLGWLRPVSTKLRCRVETSASIDSSSWLRRRRSRHCRSSSPTVMIVTLRCALPCGGRGTPVRRTPARRRPARA